MTKGPARAVALPNRRSVWPIPSRRFQGVLSSFPPVLRGLWPHRALLPLLCARLRPAGIRSRRTIGRCRYLFRDDLDAGGSAVEGIGRVFDHGELLQSCLTDLTATPQTDCAIKCSLDGLLPDQDIFYRFTATDLYDVNRVSEPVVGRFRTAPLRKRSVRFVWSGDTAGQGWGIDDVGMKTYSTMRLHEPDFFIHSGDTIYADNPIPDEIALRDGGIWKNRVVTHEKRDVARTLEEYRGQWKYNLLDDHVRQLNAVCPTFYQWDDHEVLNNWSASTDLRDDARYPERTLPSTRSGPPGLFMK